MKFYLGAHHPNWLTFAEFPLFVSHRWSYHGRREPPLPGHEVRHKNCANCYQYAAQWRAAHIGGA